MVNYDNLKKTLNLRVKYYIKVERIEKTCKMNNRMMERIKEYFLIDLVIKILF